MHLLTKLAIGAGALVAIKGIDNRLETTSYEVRSARLPKEFDGFRIAHISDLHSESIPGIEGEIKKLAPDIIAITGDMIHDDNRSYEPVLRLLDGLSKIAPVYMVSGNHDLWNTHFGEFLEAAKEKGAKFIDDDMCELERGGQRIALFGIRDPFGKSVDVINKSLEKSFSLLPDYDGYKILLFHRANQYSRLLNRDFNLILTGHMHGGQVRIKGLGGVLPPKTNLVDTQRIFFPKYTEGAYTDGNTTMIVSRGIGNPMIIPRLFNRPEIGSIILRVDSTN